MHRRRGGREEVWKVAGRGRCERGRESKGVGQNRSAMRV